MAVLGRLLIGSQQRIDLPDFLSLQSYVASDFKELIRSFVGDRALILKGFEIIDAPQAIGSASISIKVSDSVLYHPGSSAGSFFYGLADGNTLSAPLVPELRTNTVNYVYVTLSTIGAGQDTRAFWDVDLNGGQGGEFNQDINTEAVLIAQVGVSTSGFPDGVVPIAAIEMNNTSIINITDSRNMMFRLGSGGVSPDSNATFQFPPLPSTEYARNEPPSTIQNSSSPSPFFGGDKNIQTLKDWMDAVMTKLLELSGTTYWYETTQALNLVNIFDDALGSNVKSKGRWSHDESTPGLVKWSEDILYRKLNDKRDIIIRANPTTGAQLSNEQVMWIKMSRGESINPLDTPVEFANGVIYVNGNEGYFSNLNLGDWIKRQGDNENLYVRVIGFKLGFSGDGPDTASASLARSIILEEPYSGVTTLDTAVFTKGEYKNTDIQISNRNDATSYVAGGDFYWLANRSDTIMSIGAISATYLTNVNISDSDSKRAKLTFASPHDLVDGDRIVVANAGGHNGTYLVEVDSSTVVTIETTATTNPSNITVSWAVVITQARDIGSQYFSVESGRHGFASNQTVLIANTGTGYDSYNSGKYLINVRDTTRFQIPYNANTFVSEAGTATCAKIILKTELGAVEVIQGESIDINKPDAVNIMQYIGMESLSQTKPTYFLPQSYNTLNGFANYNADVTDDLTTRAAKLTAMMADRVQDRDLRITGRMNVSNQTSLVDQFITVSGSLSVALPRSNFQDIIMPGGSFYLGAYEGITFTIDRNAAPGFITAEKEKIDTSFKLSENKFVLLYRLAGSTVYTWDGSSILNSSSWTSNDYDTSQNKNIAVQDEAGIRYKTVLGVGYAYYNSNGFVKIIVPGCGFSNQVDTTAINTLYPTGFPVPDNSSVWVRVSRTFSKTFNTVQFSASYQDTPPTGAVYVTPNLDVPTDQDVIVLYTVNNGALVKLRHDFQIGNIYDEDVQLVSTQVSGSYIGLPVDSRNNNQPRSYIVGSGQLEVFLNGQRIKRNDDYQEFGTIDTPSSTIQTLTDLVIGDIISFRIGSIGGMYTTPLGYSTTTLQQAYDNSLGSNAEIQITSGTPVRIKAPGLLHKTSLPSTVALSIAGDLAVSGVVDPTAISFIPQSSSPLSVNETGLWIDNNQDLRYSSTTPSKTINVTETIKDLNDNVSSMTQSMSSVTSRLGALEAGAGASVAASSSGSVFEFLNNSGSSIPMGAIVRTELVSTGGGGGGVTLVSSQESGQDSFILKDFGQDIRWGQTFTLNETKEITKISIRLSKTGDFSGSYSMEIYQPTGSNIYSLTLGSPIGNSDGLQVSTIGSSFGWYDFVFSTPVSVVANTRYAFYLKANNLVQNGWGSIEIQYSGADVIADQVALLEGSSLSGDTLYRIYAGTASAPTYSQSISLASSSSLLNTLNVVGVAQQTILNGQSGNILVSGVATASSSSLSVGSLLYLSDTVPGSITATKPTSYGSVVLNIGVAVAADKFIFNPKLVFLNASTYEEAQLQSTLVSSGATLTLPVDSKASNSIRYYTVGAGHLTVYLNGQKLVKGYDYQEVGAAGAESNQITTMKNIESSGILEYRIGAEQVLLSATKLI
jgi:hypothetical protein